MVWLETRNNDYKKGNVKSKVAAMEVQQAMRLKLEEKRRQLFE